MTVRLLRSAVVFYLAATLAAGAPVYAQAQSTSQDQTQGQAPSQPQAQAQDQSQSQGQAPTRTVQVRMAHDYSKGKSVFPNFLAPYSPIKVETPTLTNSPRIDQLIHDGKLMLSLDDAISLALENNLDISVQRYVPWFADTDILRTKAGGAPRGTSGTGTASVLGSIPQTTYDPIVTSNFNWSRSHFPVNNPITSGTGTSLGLATLTTYNQNANVALSQGFHTGTAVSVAFDNVRNSSTSEFQFFNPSVQSTFIIQFQQQLLNGFGLLPNTRFILESKNNRMIADSTFALQVITSVAQVENAYWELIFARENVKVQEAAVATSTKLYEDNKKQVEIGTLAPIEIVRAESEVATDRQNLIVAQTTQLQDQTLLLNLITKSPTADNLLNVEIIPTDAIPTSSSAEIMPVQDAVKLAWEKRPEVHQATLTLKNDSIEVRATRNALLPTLTAFGQYSGTGLAGVNIDNVQVPPVVTTTGFPDSASTAFGTSFPSYAAGLNLTMALRNRSAQADSARARLTERQDETRYQQLKNSILVEVRNALIALQQDQARVEAAIKASELARQTLDAEQKKYQLGASTVFFVIQAQRDLTAAQGNEIRAKTDLQEAQVAYYKALGRTLDVNHITVADAKGGHVYNPPLIPGTPTTTVVAYPAGAGAQY